MKKEKELKKWMPIFWTEYLGDTGHLSTAEHGAYLLLICHYWMKGEVPWHNEELVRRITRMTSRQWALSRDVLRSFFENDGRHKRCDEELAYALEKSKRLSANAHQRHSNGRATADTPTPTPTPTKKESKKDKPPPSGGGARFFPSEWHPLNSHYAIGKQRGLSVGQVNELGEQMRDWALGGGKKKSDWNRTFNNWIRRENLNGYRGPRPLQDDSKSLTKAADRLIEQAERGQFTFGPRPGLSAQPSAAIIQLLPKGRSE